MSSEMGLYHHCSYAIIILVEEHHILKPFLLHHF